MKILIPFVVGVAIYFMIGLFTGSEEYGGAPVKDDERKQLIKQKAIVNSWVLLLIFLSINFTFDFFNLHDSRLEGIPFVYPELFYLIIISEERRVGKEC